MSVARIKAQSQNASADAEAYSVIATAKAYAEKVKIQALAEAEATRLAAEADAAATRTKAEADAYVVDAFAREMEMRRMEVARIQAYGNRTIFAPYEAGAQMGNALATGLAANMGSRAVTK